MPEAGLHRAAPDQSTMYGLLLDWDYYYLTGLLGSAWIMVISKCIEKFVYNHP